LSMRRTTRGSRMERYDLLPGRLPAARAEDPWAAMLIDPVAQLAELADLVARGLVSPEDFERQRRKVFDE
jgi:hypothetical protein